MKTYLAPVGPDVDGLPYHPTATDPRTGGPLQAIHVTKRGVPVWPVMGGSQPHGGPPPQGQQQPAGQPGQQPTPQQLGIPVLGGQPTAPGQQQPAPVPGPPPGYQPPAGYQAPPGFQPQYPYAQPYGQPQPPAGQPGQQQQNPGQQQAGNDGGQNNGQNNGQQGNHGTWDKPYPQGVPLDQMSDPQKVEFWKYHARQNEQKAKGREDYDQVVAERNQLRQVAGTDLQRAAWEAEQRGMMTGRQQVAASVVEDFFRLAARGRLSEEQVLAQLRVMDRNQFLTNTGTVDSAALSAYVDTIAPAPANPYGQMPYGQVPGAYPGGQLPPGQSPYGQQQAIQAGYGQPGAAGNPQQQPAGQAPYGQQQPAAPTYGQVPGYGQVPVPGVPLPYGQPQQQLPGAPQGYLPQPAGMVGVPVVGGRNVPDYGQGNGPQTPANGLAAGAQKARERHRTTRSEQIASTRGGQ